MIKGGKLLVTLLLVVGTAIFVVSQAKASITDGTIDPNHKYAWSSKIGWINFGATNGNVRITDTAITGYAWSQEYGWINLSPTMSGVKNTSEGVLSGYAWGENIGWINFAGITINSTGVFQGQAIGGDNSGTINFSCANCSVETDWIPASARPNPNPPGGTPLPPGSGNPPTSPFSITINNGSPLTNSTTVQIILKGGNDSSYVFLSDDPGFINNTYRLIFIPGQTSTGTPFVLSNDNPGLKNIYAKFCTQWGQCSELISNSIVFAPTPIVPPGQQPPPTQPPGQQHPPAGTTSTTPAGQIFQELGNLLSSILSDVFSPKMPVFKVPTISLSKVYSQLKLWVPYLFRTPSIIQPKIPIERFVAKITPISMRGVWDYLDPRPIHEFVFAPLPKEFLALEAKFPAVEKTFNDVGIKRMKDVEKLKTVQMYLPSLTQAVMPAASGTMLAVDIMNQMKGVPLSELPTYLKEKIPSDIIFARTGGQLVDFKVALSLNKSGNPEQKISTISNKPLHLTIRPDKPVKSVVGYLMFRSAKAQARTEMNLKDLVASAFFAEPVFASTQDVPVPTEEKLVLMQFDYLPDKSDPGLFTADIISPIPAGEYEIVTVMNYQDPSFGSKMVRLITVVDPEGYVFEKIGDKELRIPGAIATLFFYNPDTKNYQQWPAKDFQQENPQVTGLAGTYSYLVPGGMYYLTVSAPGYEPYSGKPFSVESGSGVHLNVELKTKYWWLKNIDWKTALLVAVALLLAYNFYKDKKNKNKQTN
ncbi:MAG: carboxypeptidase-like regulatory domain-containing protein [Patescibacteria group bacterium]